jgi:GTP-binding protein HflX
LADKHLYDHTSGVENCLVLHPYLKSTYRVASAVDARLGEAEGLAQAISLNVAGCEAISLSKLRPATLMGQGAVERITDLITAFKGDEDDHGEHQGIYISVVIVDAALTPIQQRNLETAWKTKVIDRTGLILEIFGERAQTKEGRLQVELAAQSYQRSRLVRSWTHLERQRGGAGFMGGPGETQIETDRRLIDQRITRLKKELNEVKRTRKLHRDSRKRIPYPIVALVGYTNAGKSTLFNRLTAADVVARDQLFATLDPTMRRLDLPSGRTVILSDTVGFVSDLPHELVSAFNATLEEVTEADVIVHVRDIASPNTESQKADVLGVLRGLGLDDDRVSEMVEILNKIDLLEPEEQEVAENRSERNAKVITLSAVTGEGCEYFLNKINDRLMEKFQILETTLSISDGKMQAWLYDHGEVLEREDGEKNVRLKVRLDAANIARFEQIISGSASDNS